MAWVNPIKKLYDPRQDANGNYLPSYATLGQINKDKTMKKSLDEFLNDRKIWQAKEDAEKEAILQDLLSKNNAPEGVTDVAGMNDYYSGNGLGIQDATLPEHVWDKANRGTSQGALKAWAGEHPMQIAGYGLGGAMNLAGLTDNDKYGGQILGAGLGAGLSSQGLGIAPWGAVPMAMAGGAIGSLFDRLRAKREQEAQYPQYR